MHTINPENFKDCKKEYDRFRKLQYDAEWENKPKQAEKYRQQALHYRELLSKGELYEPNF